MKRKLLTILILVFACCFVSLIGCEQQQGERVERIYIKEKTTEDTVFQTFVGKFDCAEYTLVAVTDNGEKEYPLTLDMISAADIVQLYTKGKYDVTVNAFGLSCKIKVEVCENEFKDLVFNGVTTTYTGEVFYLNVEGTLPQGATVLYPQGNSFSEVCNNQISAVITCPNYKTKTLYANVVITPAVYDMSNIKFESKTFIYDGEPKSVEIEGDLPEGVSVTYKIGNQTTNTQTLANETGYKVEAIFKSANVNYETIPSREAKLVIKKADYDMSKLVIADEEKEYCRQTYDAYFNLDDELPKGVSFYDIKAIYTDKDGEEQVINSQSKLIKSAVEKCVSLEDAYDYTIEYSFSIADTLNYNLPKPLISHFKIKPIEYDMSGVEFLNDAFVYDGTAKSIEVIGNYDEELHVSYEGNEQINVGEYEVTASFIVQNGVNYLAPENMKATMFIMKAELDLNEKDFEYEENVQYTGSPVFPKILTTLPTGLQFETKAYKTVKKNGETVDEETDTPIEIGEYKVKVSVVGEALSNFYEIRDLYLNYNIIKRSYDFSEFSLTREFDYDGVAHYPEAVNLPEGLSISFDNFAKDVSDGEVEVTATFAMVEEQGSTFYHDHYVLPSDIRTTVKINPVPYEKYYVFFMSPVEVLYDGNEHKIVGECLSGEYKAGYPLKDYLEVDYTMQRIGMPRTFEGNGAVEVGEYMITATLSIRGDANYKFDEYSAILTIRRGNVDVKEVEKAIRVEDTSSGKQVVFDKTLLGDYEFVYNDFLGYYEKDELGEEILVYEDPIECFFCEHDIFLKFAPSNLYSFENNGVVVENYSPSKHIVLSNSLAFTSEYNIETYGADINLYHAKKEKTYFGELSYRIDKNLITTDITSMKLIYTKDSEVFYDVDYDTTDDAKFKLILPSGIDALGLYKLEVKVEFIKIAFKESVTVNYDYDCSVNIVGASVQDSKEMLVNYLKTAPMFVVNDETTDYNTTWGDTKGEYIFDSAVTVKVNKGKFTNGGEYIKDNYVNGVKFNLSGIYYCYKETKIMPYGEKQGPSSQSVSLTQEGYYTVYLKITIEDELTGGKLFESSSNIDWGDLPYIEIHIYHSAPAVITYDTVKDIVVLKLSTLTIPYGTGLTFGSINSSNAITIKPVFDLMLDFKGDETKYRNFIERYLFNRDYLPYYLTLSAENITGTVTQRTGTSTYYICRVEFDVVLTATTDGTKFTKKCAAIFSGK